MSELTRPRPNGRVVQFFQLLRPAQAYVSVLTLGELRKGIAQRALRHPSSTDRLERWLKQLEEEFDERILLIGRSIADRWGALSSQRTRPVVDTLLAATALDYGLTMVTRNVRDVEDTQVSLYNPWDDRDLD